jgi:predicted alpha/beta-hydrolase family hydrolase
MAALAEGLGERGVATLRYQFPYMERGSRRPDPPPVAEAAVRAACTRASTLARLVAALRGRPVVRRTHDFAG